MIILASKSEARHRLLTQAGITFDALSPDVDESVLKFHYADTPPSQLAQRIADAKALSVSANHRQHVVIGSDQTLMLRDQLLNKPGTTDGARTQLRDLRGETHSLQSAVTVARDNQILFQHSATATLTMRRFSDTWLEDYITAAAPAILHCVGGYQIEGLGINLFTHIAGDSFTIQGMPLLPLLAFLRDIGEIPA